MAIKGSEGKTMYISIDWELADTGMLYLTKHVPLWILSNPNVMD